MKIRCYWRVIKEEKQNSIAVKKSEAGKPWQGIEKKTIRFLSKHKEECLLK